MSEVGSKARPTIVVGVDGSNPSRDALQWAADQAELTGAALKVVTTWEWPVTFGWAPPYPAGYSPEDDARRVLQDTLEAVLDPQRRVEVGTRVVEGHPALVLVEEADGADLLIVGSRGHGGFAGMLLGSVSEHCATNAPCPVVIIRHREHHGG